MRDSTRRRFLRTGGVVGIAGLTGCSQITGGNDIKDTDGDGVIDSEDYAPRDPDVQDAEDIEGSNSAEEDDETEDESSNEKQSNTLNESFENYPTGTLPTNWSITQGNQAGTEVVSESSVQPNAVAGNQMLAVSWNDDRGKDNTVSGWPTDSQGSHKPSEISFSLYDKVERTSNAWHFEASSSADGRVLYIIGGNEERRFRFGTGDQEWFTVRDTYWSQGWHKVEFLNIDWQNKTTNIAIDGVTVQDNVSFVGPSISTVEFRARGFNQQDLLIDDIEITLSE